MRVYQYGGGTTWNQVGADEGDTQLVNYYGTVAINAAGDRVASSDGEKGVMIGYLFTVKAVEHGANWELTVVAQVQFIILIAISELLLTLTSVESPGVGTRDKFIL